MRWSSCEKLVLHSSWETRWRRTRPQWRPFPLLIQPNIQQNSVSCHLWGTCPSQHRCAAWWRPWWSQRLDRWRSQRGGDLEKTTGKEHEGWVSFISFLFTHTNVMMLRHAEKMMNTNIASIILQPFYTNLRGFKSLNDSTVTMNWLFFFTQCHHCSSRKVLKEQIRL